MAEESKDKALLEEARDHYKAATEGWSEIYDLAKKDIDFVYDVGEGQWPSDIRNEREKNKRPCLTINKIQKFVRQIRGDMMQNRPRIKVIPVDNNADTRMAELYNGIIRQIEYLSSAEIAYDTAYGHAIASSVGFFRLVTQYEGDDSFNQEIRIKRIINPLAVHFDPHAVEFTLNDARYCFVEEMIDKKDFERLYPDADVAGFSGTEKAFGDWFTTDRVRVAEYFYKEPVRKKIVLLQSGEVVELTKDVTIEFIKANGGIPIRDRIVDTHQVKWCKLNGGEVLERGDWLGKDIPIIPVFGDEIVSEGKRYYLSLARGAKGPAQMYNYWATAATENVALSPKSPFLVDARQIKGFEPEWEESNRTNRMFLRYHAIKGLQKPSREPQTQVPNAIMAMMQQTGLDIEDHLGRYEASTGQASNERSGKAILARVAQSDKGTYTFVDNFTRAIVYAGRQLIDLIPKIYDTARAVNIMGEDGAQRLEMVNQPIQTEAGVRFANDLSVGKFDLIASLGASFSSKRQEMVEMLIQSMQYAPMLAPVIAPLIFKYSDFPGGEEVYAEIQKRVAAMEAQGGIAQ